MNKRKLVDYTSMYEALATLMKTELPEVELYFAIGWAVCARPEKGAAVMAAEHLQASCPESKGFSPRNLRRMREFYRAYADSRELQALALKLGWTQNVAILEGCEGSQERAWYLRAALEHRWTKTELMEQIAAVGGEGISGARLVITGDGRLLRAEVGGKPIDPNGIYVISTLDYLAEGNDKMYALKDNLSKKVTNIAVRDLIMESIRRTAAQGDKITARMEGRIVKQ